MRAIPEFNFLCNRVRTLPLRRRRRKQHGDASHHFHHMESKCNQGFPWGFGVVKRCVLVLGRGKLLVFHVEHLWLVPVLLCCCRGQQHKGMCWQRLKGDRDCSFGQSGFETVLLPWKLEGSHIKLDQGTDDTECPLLCSQTCGPAQRIGWQIGEDK